MWAIISIGYDLSQSIMVGDNRSDMQCAINAHLRTGYWLTNKPQDIIALTQLSDTVAENSTQVLQINTLRDCLHLI